jgi:hypothetical protein
MRQNIANLENLDERGLLALLSWISRYYAWAVRTAYHCGPFEREDAIMQMKKAGRALDAVRAAYAGQGQVLEAYLRGDREEAKA